jgi:hypothetical protein
VISSEIPRYVVRAHHDYAVITLLLIAFDCALVPSMAGGQGLTATLIGTVRDEQGSV